MDATLQRPPRGSGRATRPQRPETQAAPTGGTRRPSPPPRRTQDRSTAQSVPQDPRRSLHAHRNRARRRLAHALTATIPLTELVLLAALLAFPEAATGTLLPVAGVVAFVASAALVAGQLVREARHTARRDRALARAAAAGVVAATLVAWIPILGALALAAL